MGLRAERGAMVDGAASQDPSPGRAVPIWATPGTHGLGPAVWRCKSKQTLLGSSSSPRQATAANLAWLGCSPGQPAGLFQRRLGSFTGAPQESSCRGRFPPRQLCDREFPVSFRHQSSIPGRKRKWEPTGVRRPHSSASASSGERGKRMFSQPRVQEPADSVMTHGSGGRAQLGQRGSGVQSQQAPFLMTSHGARFPSFPTPRLLPERLVFSI